jgi:hypothetical protein
MFLFSWGKRMKYLHIENMQQTRGFTFIGWAQLTQLVSHPQSIQAVNAQEAKKQSKAITASDCPSKRLEAMTDHDRFTLLRLDLDDTEHTLETVSDIMARLGIGSYIIHTTASHKQDGKGSRYRVYIELAQALTLEEWRIVQTYLAYSLAADDCSNRPQQIMFLPVRFAGGEYQYHINEGSPLTVYGSQLFDEAIAFDVEQKHKVLAIEQEKANQIKPAHQEPLLNGQASIIDAVNLGYSWPNLLTQYGYKRQGCAWLAPESTSKSAGVYLLTGQDGKERYYSHHSSDPCAIGKCIDKFDFLTIRTFGGDAYTALKALSKNFPEHHAHNRRQYIDYQRARKLHTIREEL